MVLCMNNMILFRTLFLLFFALKCAGSSKILGVFPMPGISHYILSSKLMKGLLEAGHDVTMISPYKMKDLPKNGRYTDVILDGFAEDFQAMMSHNNFFEMGFNNPVEAVKKMVNIFIGFTNNTFYHPNVKKLLQSNTQFDAVIMEQFCNDGIKVFSHIYDCPAIILSSMGPNGWINPLVGNPQPISYVPHMRISNFSPDSVLDRTKNLIFHLIEYLATRFYILPNQESIMHQAFPKAPPLYDLNTNVSMILLNSHTSIYNAVPLVPNMVEIGGYFIDPPKKLPDDLQDFFDRATDGAIYFSMGSTLKSKNMSNEKKKIILNVLGKLKQKVLWKFEEDLSGKPANVMIRQWCPQQDILDRNTALLKFLAHPNIKLFITHGGLLSITETIYHEVPILAIPVFADQPANAQKAVAGGFGLKLEYQDPDFSEEKLSSLINELLNNPKYKENVQRRSKLYHDRPQKPMETAVYWVDYVIRHKGALHLRVAGVKMPWYQYFMVDVIGVLLISIFVTLYISKLLFKKLFCKNTKPYQSTKKIKST